MENITVDLIIKGIVILSAITNLTTQGVKALLNEKEIHYSANLLAVIVSAVSTVILCSIYGVIKQIPFNATTVVIVIALIWISFLIATVGYDKVMQLVKQITAFIGGGENDG